MRNTWIYSIKVNGAPTGIADQKSDKTLTQQIFLSRLDNQISQILEG